MALTIYDIARIAGVSIATVSRVFNNPESVSEGTRLNILEIAHKHGYHPQAFAQALASKKTKSIAVIVPVLSNYFFMEILSGIQDQLLESENELVLVNIMSGMDAFQQVQHQVKRRWADGYILVSTHLTDEQYDELASYQVPMVLIDDYHPAYDTVTTDNIEGAYQATRYLIDQGANRIAMISASKVSRPIKLRIKGYKKALLEAGIFDESLIFTGDSAYRDGFSEKNGYEAMKKLLSTCPKPDACFCTSDIKGIGALKAMREMNCEIPMVCYDNLSISSYIGLSTIAQPMQQMGARSVTILLDRLLNPNTVKTNVTFTPTLVIREPSVTVAAG